jgi:hypothetical protein
MGFWNRLFGKKSAAPTQRSQSSSSVTPIQKSAAVSGGSAAGPGRKPASAASLIVEELQAEADSSKKCQLIKNLGKHRGDEVVEALVRCLKDPDEKVRLCAVGTLQDVGDARAVEPLIELLMTDTAHQPCYYATKALARFKTPRAIAGMVSALESEMGDLSELAFQLGEVRAREAVDALCKLVEGSGDERAYARRHAVMSLANISDRRAIPALTKALNDSDGGVRERAQNALRSFGENPVAPFTYIDGWIVRYPDLDQAQKDVAWLVENLATTVPDADFDIGIAKVEDKDSCVVIVTSNYPNFWKVFRVEIYPKLSSKSRDLDGMDLQGSDERTLPFYLGQGGKLLMHRYLPHASSTSR